MSLGAKNLAVPPGRPPSLVFPFIWAGIYASMGYASSLAIMSYDYSEVPSLRYVGTGSARDTCIRLMYLTMARP